jgi:hypothetical protein
VVVNVTAIIIESGVTPCTEHRLLAQVDAVAQQHQQPERLLVLTARVSAIRDALKGLAQPYQLPIIMVELPDAVGPTPVINRVLQQYLPQTEAFWLLDGQSVWPLPPTTLAFLTPKIQAHLTDVAVVGAYFRGFSAAGVLIPCAVLQQLGLFDERYYYAGNWGIDGTTRQPVTLLTTAINWVWADFYRRCEARQIGLVGCDLVVTVEVGKLDDTHPVDARTNDRLPLAWQTFYGVRNRWWAMAPYLTPWQATVLFVYDGGQWLSRLARWGVLRLTNQHAPAHAQYEATRLYWWAVYQGVLQRFPAYIPNIT